MKAINVSALANASCHKELLAGKVNWSIDPATQIVTFTDATTLESGDTYKGAVITAYDKFGGVKHAKISAAAGTATIDLDAAPALNTSEGVSFTVTVSSAKKAPVDGSVHLVNALAITSGSFQIEK